MSLYNQLKFLNPKPAFNTQATTLTQGSRTLFPQVPVKIFIREEYRSALLLAIAVAFFTFSLSAFIASLPSRSTVTQNSRALSAAAPVVEAASGGKPTLEVHIANNGLVLLRGAKILAINGTTLTVGTGWGSSNFVWTVTTAADSYGTHNYGTKFIDLNGNPIAVENMQVGDLVTITGMLDQNTKDPALAADMVRILK